MSAGTGLRERKRLAAMRRIQQVALELFDEHGYRSVTIERIAEDAEVSQSSVYRYFGTKEQLVLWNEHSDRILEIIASQIEDHPPVEAVRRAADNIVSELFGGDQQAIRRRMRYAMEEPDVRAALAVRMQEITQLLAGMLARGSASHTDDLQHQVAASTIVGAVIGAVHHWYASGYASSFDELLKRALAILEDGLQTLS